MSRVVDRDAFPLDPDLAFLAHLWRLEHAIERLSRRMDQRLGCTAQQRFILRCVGTYPGITAGQLAAVLHVDPGTLSTALRRLEERGLVERRRDASDQRRVGVGLTRRGRALDAPTSGTVEAATEQLLSGTTAEEVATAARVLARFAALVDETG